MATKKNVGKLANNHSRRAVLGSGLGRHSTSHLTQKVRTLPPGAKRNSLRAELNRRHRVEGEKRDPLTGRWTK